MTVHAAPTTGLTPCCWRPVDLLPDDDQLSSDPRHVTCTKGATMLAAEHLAKQIAARRPEYTPHAVAEIVGLPIAHVRQLLDRP